MDREHRAQRDALLARQAAEREAFCAAHGHDDDWLPNIGTPGFLWCRTCDRKETCTERPVWADAEIAARLEERRMGAT